MFDSIKKLFKKSVGKVNKFFRKIGKTSYKKVIDTILPHKKNFNRFSLDTIRKFGDNKIKSIRIERTPLGQGINTAGDVLTMGWFSNKIKSLGFDRLFHLALVLTLDNGREVIYEKNEQIYIKTRWQKSDKTEIMKLPFNQDNLTINLMIERTRKRLGDGSFFDYDAYKNNCQHFIKTSLETSGLLTPEAKEFLYQDLEELYDEMKDKYPALPFITKALTRTQALLNN